MPEDNEWVLWVPLGHVTRDNIPEELRYYEMQLFFLYFVSYGIKVSNKGGDAA